MKIIKAGEFASFPTSLSRVGIGMCIRGCVFVMKSKSLYLQEYIDFLLFVMLQ